MAGKASVRPTPAHIAAGQPLPQKSFLKSRWPWLAVAVIVLLVGLGSAVAIRVRQSKTNTNVVVKNSNTTTKNGNINASVSGGPVGKVVEVTNDADHDGLTDEEEKSLGTNPNLVDTDHDGLSDYDEVKVYKTNPLKPDTDGDGVIDGTEVKKGYNPNGSGKLLDFEAAKSKIK